jgi:hypothetical protein
MNNTLIIGLIVLAAILRPVGNLKRRAIHTFPGSRN